MSSFLEQTLAIHSSPALCGIKASNLINLEYSENLLNEIEEIEKKYKRIKFYILKNDYNKALILVYRENVLERKLFEYENINFLSSLGYDTSSVNSLLESLKERINESDEFPHEIGVFLGYDLSDIKSFIKGDKCLYVGYWKVYSNVEEKVRLFNKYSRCKDIVIKMIDNGYSIENFMR